MGQENQTPTNSSNSAPATPSGYYKSSKIKTTLLYRQSSELLPNDTFRELSSIKLEFSSAISNLLKLILKLKTKNDKNNTSTTSSTIIITKNCFYEGDEETISLLISQVKYEPKILILALIYTTRILDRNILNANRINLSRLFFIALVTAIKYQAPIEQILKNSEYAKILKISNEIEFRNMELEFLKLLNNKLFVDKVELCYTQKKIIEFIKMTQKMEITTGKSKSADMHSKMFGIQF